MTTAPTFDARRHTYHLAGQQLVSVTQVLGIVAKPELLAWYGKYGTAECVRMRDEAAAHGTNIHEWAERIAKRDATVFEPFGLTCSDAERPFIEAFHAWFVTNVRTVIAAEPRVASSKFGYAGSIDLVAEMADGLGVAVLDLKTGSMVPETTPHQLAAYQRALLETSDVDAPRRISVHLPRKRPGVLEVYEYPVTEAAEDFRIFLCALLLFRRFGRKEQR